ncbi:diguanylate cyclase [Chitiniphilus purpureus]|uniref:Diguanylate cyclase n=1 Tax=Chitiniphilus purpureus TaxID=2981137 RepID=A0ABY6DU59_9NEIS|nr:sensor domain-containing diguanylate cyclase [Chitiniphilus sp. CD1]UXY15403.1 diguanylate cyclase [Chitiniphilus sp. CD1]
MRFIRHQSVYFVVVLGWVLLTLAVLAIYAGLLLNQSRDRHQRLHQQLQDRLWFQFAGAATALETFAAFQSVPRSRTFQVDHAYARQLLARYPQLHRLELIRRVPAEEAPRFIRAMRELGFPGFSLHTLAPDGRTMLPAPPARDYYPVVFTEPYAEHVQGLDLGAVIGTLPENEREPLTSAPFQTASGRMAYRMVRPAGFSLLPQAVARNIAPPVYVSVVVSIDMLAPEPVSLPRGMQVSVHHADAHGATLFERTTAPISTLERRWFPELTLITHIPSTTQSYLLETRWQLGWSALDRTTLGMLLGMLVLLLAAALGIVRLVRARHFARLREAERMAHMASHDALTGLANRRGLDEALGRCVAQHRPCSLIFLDLDRFKPINDEHGHEAGDFVLRNVAERLTLCVRANDTLSRWGGDEFALLLSGEMNSARERELLRRLSQALMEPIAWQDHHFTVGASLGVAHYPRDGVTAQQILQAADRRMYHHKEQRRNNPLAPPPMLAFNLDPSL